MNKYIAGPYGFTKEQGDRNAHQDRASKRKGLGWVLPAMGWYLLWLYVMVDGFIPLQIAP